MQPRGATHRRYFGGCWRSFGIGCGWSRLTSRSLGCCFLGVGFIILMLVTRTANSRHSNVVSIYLQCEVLKGLRITRWQRRIFLRLVNNLFISICKMIDPVLSDGRNMIQAVQEIGGPEGVGLGFRDCISKSAHGWERATSLVAQVADDCLVRAVFASPVSGPAYLVEMFSI